MGMLAGVWFVLFRLWVSGVVACDVCGVLVFGLGLVVFVRVDACVGVLFVRLFAVLFV